IKIRSVEPLHFEDINEFHAEQEAIELPKLKQLIREIYPNTDTLFVIEYELIK
ncbi:ASCH domain-containing protein, partial [Vibrio alginolyticus]